MKKQRFLPPRSMAIVAVLVVGLLGCEALQQAQHRRNNRLKEDLQQSVEDRDLETAHQPGSPAALVGQAAPDFTLQNLQGSAVTLSELKGKAVVLNFWATW